MQKCEGKLYFSDRADQDIKKMREELFDMMRDAQDALEAGDLSKAEKVITHEAALNYFQEKLKKGHVKRLKKGECDLKAGIVFIELVDNFEKIGDHLTNIAQGVIRGMKWQDIFEPVWEEETEQV
jgi:phosphate:Na+ symporter